MKPLRAGPGGSVQLLHGDVFEQLDRLLAAGAGGSVDLAFADPPYFIGKAAWDKPRSHHEVYAFQAEWLVQVRDLLAPNGSLWVSGDSTCIYAIGHALQSLGMKILNSVAWVKPNPHPHSGNLLQHSFETLVWAKRSKSSRQHFDANIVRRLLADGRKLPGSVWPIPVVQPRERRHGRHPTQKPEQLLERIVLTTSRPGDLVLDPFVGSGTTAVAAVRHGRRFVGIDENAGYLDIARRRIAEEVASSISATDAEMRMAA